YLHDEPVLACPPSAWYRLTKFARRNKARLTAAVFLIVLLVFGVIGVLIADARVLAEEKKRGDAEAQRAAEAAKRRDVEARRAEEATKRAEEEAKRADAEKEKARFTNSLRAALAFHYWQDNNVTAADALLDRCDADMRHWEWHYVKRLCHSELTNV